MNTTVNKQHISIKLSQHINRIESNNFAHRRKAEQQQTITIFVMKLYIQTLLTKVKTWKKMELRQKISFPNNKIK